MCQAYRTWTSKQINLIFLITSEDEVASVPSACPLPPRFETASCAFPIKKMRHTEILETLSNVPGAVHPGTWAVDSYSAEKTGGERERDGALSFSLLRASSKFLESRWLSGVESLCNFRNRNTPVASFWAAAAVCLGSGPETAGKSKHANDLAKSVAVV